MSSRTLLILIRRHFTTASSGYDTPCAAQLQGITLLFSYQEVVVFASS